MVGAIDKRDILAHPFVTIRCFGWRVFLRAIFAGRDKTFLSVLADAEVLKPAAENVVEFVARCVELELKASRIYAALARHFAATRRARILCGTCQPGRVSRGAAGVVSSRGGTATME